MYEGKPLLLVIGGSDTGRTPIAAALLRRALGAGAIVLTAGVLSHAGESAAPEAQMALEQIGVDLSRHISRPLDDVDHQAAELLLAVDRGTELVLFTRFPKDPRVGCLSVMADMPDVLDPHRMPLGVWVAVVRQIEEQVAKALPTLRQRLGVAEQEPVEASDESINIMPSEPFMLGAGPRKLWESDEEMQRLMRLINEEQGREAEPIAEPGSNGVPESFQADEAPSDSDFDTGEAGAAAPSEPQASAAPPAQQAAPSEPQATSRADDVTRMGQMLEAAGSVPEIIDWQRLRQELIARLRSVARQPMGGIDFAPAAALMIEGKLVQHSRLPDREALYLLHRSILRLRQPLTPADLATVGGELAQW